MLFSILTPTFNRSQLVRASIRSYLDFIRASGVAGEIVIVDDGSSDNTVADIRCDFAADLDSGILKLAVLEKNVGWTNARNAGARHTAGDWILFADSDDLLDVSRAVEFVALLQRHANLGVIFTRCISRTYGTLIGPAQTTEAPVNMQQLMGEGTPTGECLVAVRRDAVLAIPFEPKWQGFENITYARQIQKFGGGIVSPLAVRIYGDAPTGDRLSLLPQRIRRARSMVYGNAALIKNFWHFLTPLKKLKMLARLGFYLPFYLFGLCRK